MIGFTEIRWNVVGALRLARGDVGGLEHFDDTIERFWRSFWAAVVCAPLFVIILLSLPQDGQIKDWTRYFLVATANYAIAWTLWPLVMVYLTQWIDRPNHFYRYMQAYNWAQVVGTTFKTLIVALAGGSGGQGLGVLLTFATLAILFYEWFITRAALQVSSIQAAGIVVFNLVLVITVDYAAIVFTRL